MSCILFKSDIDKISLSKTLNTYWSYALIVLCATEHGLRTDQFKIQNEVHLILPDQLYKKTSLKFKKNFREVFLCKTVACVPTSDNYKSRLFFFRIYFFIIYICYIFCICLRWLSRGISLLTTCCCTHWVFRVSTSISIHFL